MNNNIKSRIEDKSKIISLIAKGDVDMQEIKILGKGVEGTVMLVQLDKYKIALKVINLTDVKNLKKENLLLKDGFTEVYASKLINLLLDNKINPHFVYNYKSLQIKNTLVNYNEFIQGETLRSFLKKKYEKKTLRSFLKKKDDEKILMFNIFFQILSALHSLQFHFDMIHADLHFENILIAKIPEGGYWKYKINGTDYYLPNMGYQIYINDYGYAMIPEVLGKKWYSDLFDPIANSNKYNFYDLLLIKMEFHRYLSPYFHIFFEKYFNYTDTDEYRRRVKMPYFPEDLDILDIIELLFNKNEISNCKTLEWYCYTDAERIKNEKLIEEYNLDKKLDDKEIVNILKSKI